MVLRLKFCGGGFWGRVEGVCGRSFEVWCWVLIRVLMCEILLLVV